MNDTYINMMSGYYSDMYGTEFDCIILACSIDGGKYKILDLDDNCIGWCDCSLVDDNY